MLLFLVAGCVKYFSPLESFRRFIFLFHFFPHKTFGLYKEEARAQMKLKVYNYTEIGLQKHCNLIDCEPLERS